MTDKEKLISIRNGLYDSLPSGQIDAFQLTTVIANHIKALDEFIDSSLPAPTQDGTAEEKGEKNKAFYSALKYVSDLPINNMKLFKSLAFEMMSDYAAPIRAEIVGLVKTIEAHREQRELDRICYENKLAAANQRVKDLEEILKSDSVYGLLRFAYKSPESAQVYDVGDNKYYDLYVISKELRNRKPK